MAQKAKKTLNDLADLVEVQEQLEEEELEQFPEELWEKINGGIELGVVEISGKIDQLAEALDQRDKFYLARGQIINAMKLALEDATTPLGTLAVLLEKAKTRVDNTRKIAGISVPRAPYGSSERKLVEEIETRLSDEKKRIGDLVARDYGFKNAQQVFDYCDQEQKLWDKGANKQSSKKG